MGICVLLCGLCWCMCFRVLVYVCVLVCWCMLVCVCVLKHTMSKFNLIANIQRVSRSFPVGVEVILQKKI